MKSIRNLLIVFAFTCFASTVYAQLPGQLTDVQVTDGYFAGLFIVLNGQTNIGQMHKGTVFVNDFSTRLTPEGKFSIMFPVASITAPPDPNGTIVTVTVWDEKTNVILTSKFNLKDLNKVMRTKIKPEFLWQKDD